jgi:molecular chaperone HscB
MTHFELFNLPPTLQPDPALVRQKFLALSRQYHPDFHSQASDEEQVQALENSSQLNMAYKVFQDPDATIKYVLKLKGLLEEEEKYQLAPEFLMQMLDLNDQAMEAGTREEKDNLLRDIAHLKLEIYEPVEAIITNYQEGVTSEEELLQVKEYYYRKKYLTD